MTSLWRRPTLWPEDQLGPSQSRLLSRTPGRVAASGIASRPHIRSRFHVAGYTDCSSHGNYSSNFGIAAGAHLLTFSSMLDTGQWGGRKQPGGRPPTGRRQILLEAAQSELAHSLRAARSRPSGRASEAPAAPVVGARR